MNKKIFISILLAFFFSSTFAQVIVLDGSTSGSTVSTCNATIYDSGGPNGNYGINEDFQITICSEIPGSPVILEIINFDTESSFDELSIYDGTQLTSPTLVLDASGAGTITGNIYESSGNCLTITFSSDGSVTRTGFEIQVSCGIECQDYTVDITDVNPPVTNQDSLWIDICPGDDVTFTAQGSYPNNNVNYPQSDATTNYIWTLISGNTAEQFEGEGLSTFNHTFDEPGGYFIRLSTADYNGCNYNVLEEYRVRVSLPPIFETVSANPDVICPGEPVNLTGIVSTDSWVMPITDEQDLGICIDDYVGVVQTFCWTVNAFATGQEIENAEDLESVCMNIEHSFMGDLWMYIQCPNGQQATIHEYSTCNGAYLGDPDHADDCEPGEGFDYCWTMDAANSHTDICSFGSTIPSGDYQPMGTFEDLVGCPINGEWCVVIIDDWALDDGTIFSVSLNFSESITPSDMWTIEMEYDDADMLWSGDGTTGNSGGSIVANPSTSGEQTMVFSVTDDFGCTYEAETLVEVLSQDDPSCCVLPVPYAGEDAHICDDNYTFDAILATGNTGFWTMISGPGNANFSNQTSPNATVTVDAWGVYEFSWTEEYLSPSCAAADNITVEFYPIPTTTFTHTPILCYGNQTTITYVGNVGPDATYYWGFDGGTAVGVGQGPYLVNWADAGLHEISLRVSANDCHSEDTVVSINNPPRLTHELTYENDPCFQSCQGFAYVEVEGGTLPYDFSWESGNPYLNDLCAGSYSIQITDANGCTSGPTEHFVIYEPIELALFDTTIVNVRCHGNPEGSIDIEAYGGTGELTYIWGDIGAGPSYRDSLFAENYPVTVVDENGCELPLSFAVTQPDELVVDISPDISICEGETTTIEMLSFGGTEPHTFLWLRGEEYTIGGSSIIVAPDTTRTYYAYVVDGNGCVSETMSMTVTVSPEFIIDSLNITDVSCHDFCDGQARLYLRGGIPPLNYSWGSDNHTYSDLCAGQYNLTVTDVIGCNIMTNFIVAQPTPLTYIPTVKNADCYNEPSGEAAIYVQGGTQPYSYLWPDGNTDSIMNNIAGTYRVTVTDANNCKINHTYNIYQPDELITTPVYDKTICFGQSVTLSTQATGGSPYYDFQWTGSDGSVFPVNTTTVTPSENTSYTVVVTDSLGCTSEPRVVNVTIQPPLEILSVVTSYQTICEGEYAIIQVDAQGGNGGPYLMTLQDGSVVSSPFKVYPEETTMYVITLNDNCGTTPVKDSILINVRPKPQNSVIADKINGCVPLTVNFQETSPNTGQTYLWNFGEGGYSELKQPTYTYNKPGVYNVTLEIRDNYGCVNKRVRENYIQVYSIPTANFYPDPEITTMVSAEILFNNKSVDAEYFYWFFGDGDSSNFVSPRHTYNDIGEYEAMLVAETYHGCRDTAYQNVVVGNEFTFYAPTTFTPNGDGVNDCFRVCGNGIDRNNFFLAVYDRWGNRVFETETYRDNYGCESCGKGSWDGTNNGDRLKGDEILSNGAYYWHCDFRDLTGTKHSKTGTIHIVR